MNRPIFGYDYNGTNIEWTWNVREVGKIYWKPWRPRLNHVKILSTLQDDMDRAIIKEEIYESVMESEHPKKEKLTGIYKVRRKANG